MLYCIAIILLDTAVPARRHDVVLQDLVVAGMPEEDRLKDVGKEVVLNGVSLRPKLFHAADVEAPYQDRCVFR